MNNMKIGSQHNIDDYEYDLFHVGETEVIDLSINVIGDEIFLVQNNLGGNTIDADYQKATTINEIFDYVRGALQALYYNDEVEVRELLVTYDANHSYPNAMTYRYTSANGSSHHIILTVTNFSEYEGE